MKIWLVQTGEIIPFKQGDRMMRTGYLAHELVSRGYDVTWWTGEFEHQSKKFINDGKNETQLHSGLKIQYLKNLGYQRNISVKRFLDHLLVARDFMQRAKKMQELPDVIVNSLPDHNLAYRVAQFATQNKIPLITDVRDYWPDFILSAFDSKVLKTAARLILNRDFKRANYVFEKSDVLLSMMKTMLDWAQKKVNRIHTQNDSVFYIGSSRILDLKTSNVSDKLFNIKEKCKDTFNVLYLGTFTKVHNPEPLLLAAKLLNEKSKSSAKINFILAGTGDYQERIVEHSKDIPNIHLTGWLGQAEIAEMLKISHIGIIPLHSDVGFFPNKAFGYFSGGLPVISSTIGEFADFIETNKLGLNFDYFKPEQLAEHIEFFLSNPEVRTNYAKNVREMFEKEFDSAIVYKNYADLVENIAKKELTK